MSKKDRAISKNETGQMKFYHPTFIFDPLKEAVKGIERIIFDSGLPYNMEYRPDDGYFSLELYKSKEEN